MSDGSGQVEWEHLEICVEADLSGTEVVLDVMLHHSNTTNASSSPVEVLPEAVRGSVQLVLSNVPATIITIDLLRLLGGLLVGGSLIELLELRHPSDPLMYMVLLTFSTPRAAQLFARRFGGKHYTTLDPARARAVRDNNSKINGNAKTSSSTCSGSSSGSASYFRPPRTEQQTCPICLEPFYNGAGYEHAAPTALPLPNATATNPGNAADPATEPPAKMQPSDPGSASTAPSPRPLSPTSGSSTTGNSSARSSNAGGGEVRLLCSHRFHIPCLAKCTGMTHCPVCRYTQSAPAPNVCDEPGCGSREGLWMCLICGMMACGREQWTGGTPTSPGFFSETGSADNGDGDGDGDGEVAAGSSLKYWSRGHALLHFKTTSHAFAQDPETHRVWDYYHDRYTTRLVLGDGSDPSSTAAGGGGQRSAGGGSSSVGSGGDGGGGGGSSSFGGNLHKVVEIGPTGALIPSSSTSNNGATGASVGTGAAGNNADGFSEAEAGEALSLEFTHLLTTQLDAQRAVHENRLLISKRECGSKVRAAEAAQHKVATLLSELKCESDAVIKDVSDKQRKIARIELLLNKVSAPSADEAEMTTQLSINHREWAAKVDAAQADSARAVAALDAEIAGLQSEYQALLERLSEPD